MPVLPASPLRRDMLAAIVVAVAAQVELTLVADRVVGAMTWHRLLGLLILPALSLRRRAPAAAALIAAGALAATPVIGTAPVATPFLCLLLLLVSLGWHGTLAHGAIGVGGTLLGLAVGDVAAGGVSAADVVVNTVLIVAAWLGAHLLRRATDRRVAAEVETDRRARDAVEAERTRIAQDLHDSLAHTLTLMTLQAGGARERTAEPGTRRALESIETAGREGLADMQRFLGLLGPSEGEAPGMADLMDLADGVRRSGLAVELDLDADHVPASLSTTVYRVVQEALTNMVRHSTATRARVRVRRADGQLVAQVCNDGGTRAPRAGGSGRGLAGLAARLELFDGTLRSEPTPDGWKVEARIPLPESSR